MEKSKKEKKADKKAKKKEKKQKKKEAKRMDHTVISGAIRVAFTGAIRDTTHTYPPSLTDNDFCTPDGVLVSKNPRFTHECWRKHAVLLYRRETGIIMLA